MNNSSNDEKIDRLASLKKDIEEVKENREKQKVEMEKTKSFIVHLHDVYLKQKRKLINFDRELAKLNSNDSLMSDEVANTKLDSNNKPITSDCKEKGSKPKKVRINTVCDDLIDQHVSEEASSSSNSQGSNEKSQDNAVKSEPSVGSSSKIKIPVSVKSHETTENVQEIKRKGMKEPNEKTVKKVIISTDNFCDEPTNLNSNQKENSEDVRMTSVKVNDDFEIPIKFDLPNSNVIKPTIMYQASSYANYHISSENHIMSFRQPMVPIRPVIYAKKTVLIPTVQPTFQFAPNTPSNIHPITHQNVIRPNLRYSFHRPSNH